MTNDNDDVKVVEVPTILSEGEFGISINNIEHMTVMGNSIMFWFNKEHMSPERGWDLQVPFGSSQEAEEALEDFRHIVRRLQMRRVK